jgi:hypothetical protein
MKGIKEYEVLATLSRITQAAVAKIKCLLPAPADAADADALQKLAPADEEVRPSCSTTACLPRSPAHTVATSCHTVMLTQSLLKCHRPLREAAGFAVLGNNEQLCHTVSISE